jgi:hypothetical protein
MNYNYAYFLLSKTWELNSDILQLVKKWLEPHLNRRILNEDYNQFMINAKSQFNKNSLLLNKQEIMLSRYGFKIYINYNLKRRENLYNIKCLYGSIMPHLLYELHDEYSKQYKIFGISINMRDKVVYLNNLCAEEGVTDYSRNIFITNFRYKNPKHWRWKWPLTACEQKNIIRKIMDKEEKIIMDTWEDY